MTAAQTVAPGTESSVGCHGQAARWVADMRAAGHSERAIANALARQFRLLAADILGSGIAAAPESLPNRNPCRVGSATGADLIQRGVGAAAGNGTTRNPDSAQPGARAQEAVS